MDLEVFASKSCVCTPFYLMFTPHNIFIKCKLFSKIIQSQNEYKD